MDNLPSNSNHPRRSPQERPDGKKIQPVVTGPVERRKRSWSKRFRENLMGEDAGTVGEYVLLEVLVPAFKDMIADAAGTGVERMIFGESRSSSRRTRGSQSSGYTNYGNRYASGGGGSTSRHPAYREERPSISRRARASHDFGEIVLSTRAEAEEVLKRMDDRLERYEQVSVSDLYEMLDISGDYTDLKYGWVDLHTARVSRLNRGGYLLDLPRPELLD